MTGRRRLAVAATVLPLAVGAALAVWRSHPLRADGPATLPIGGPFRLEAAGGRPVTDASFRGRLMLVYFGYTHCPDACPLALNTIASALARLGGRRGHVAALFITVDPARDTPALVDRYARTFDPAIVGLTGSEQQIAAVEREYRVYAARHAQPGGGYSMDHSNIIYLMDERGRFAGFLDGNATARQIADRIVQESKAAS